MWGNAFADLAKKAQDLQEQAKEQASHISVSTVIRESRRCALPISSPFFSSLFHT